jgi:hypothetical protein
MSVRVMTAVWALSLADSQKIVLLALADSANDEGHCWPSMASLVRKCSKSERTIQGVIKQLVDAGHLTRREVLGKGCNYSVHPRDGCAPATAAPPPAEDAPPPRSGCGQTVIEPSNNRKSARKRAAIRPDDIPEGLWDDVLALRKAKRAPWTQTAFETVKLEADKAGWPLGDALTAMVARGWQGFEAEWVEKRAARSNGPIDPNAGSHLARYQSGEIDFEEFNRLRTGAEPRTKATGPPRPIGQILRAVSTA